MKNIVLVLFLLCFSFITYAQCTRDTNALDPGISIICSGDPGRVGVEVGLPAIRSQGMSFNFDTLYANVGEAILFKLAAIHNAVEVDQATWLANGTTSNGGFSLPLGADASVMLTTPGTYYYVCQPHVSMGMKGVIIVTSIPFTYKWYSASDIFFTTILSTQEYFNTSACGGYKLKVFDHNGDSCHTFSRFLKCPLSISPGPQKNIKCSGDSTGEIQMVAKFGWQPYNYAWYDSLGIYIGGGPNDSVRSNLFAGKYILVVTDDSLCIATDTVNVSETDPLLSEIMVINTADCYGDSTAVIEITIKGGKKISTQHKYFYYLVNLTNNDTVSVSDSSSIFANFSHISILSGLNPGLRDTIRINNLIAGDYKFIAVDTNNCFLEDTITISQPDSISITFHPAFPTLLCHGEHTDVIANISGGTPDNGGNYSIKWDNDSILSQTILDSGLHQINVQDNKGCLDSNTVLVSGPNPLTINKNTIDPSCLDNDGTIDLFITGGTPFTNGYHTYWSTDTLSNDSLSIYGLSSGFYTVMIEDTCGSINDTIKLTQMQSIISASDDYDSFTLWSWITAANGDPPYNIIWNMPDGTKINKDSIQGLCPGENYIYEVTDSMGCTLTDTANIPISSGPLVDYNTQTVIDSSWGMGPFSYLWSDGQTTPHADSLCEGTHSVTVTAHGGLFACILSDSFPINPLELSIDPALDLVDCKEEFYGEITVTPSGGTPQYTYSWSTGDTDNHTTTDLYPGTYYVSVFDKNGCKLDTSVKIGVINLECIPNVFSPNYDGINDFWDIGESFLFPDSEVTVYGRFGKKMFESVGYKIPWKGKTVQDNRVPEGTYFYIIDIKHGIDPIKGTVTILR